MKIALGGLRTVALGLLVAAGLALTASAATIQTKPKLTAPPVISGTAAVGQTLTASSGSWSGTTPMTFSYQWARSNAKGGFDPIQGATTIRYTVASADMDHGLLVQVKAKNANGVAWANSKQTGSVTNPPGNAIPVSGISLPDRLVISGFKTTPMSNLGSLRGSLQAQFQVTDTQGHPVQGALVYAVGVPYGWAKSAPEQPTGADGWASVEVTPTAQMPSAAKHLVLFLRARKPGDSLLAGVSTRRLVQASFPAL